MQRRETILLLILVVAVGLWQGIPLFRGLFFDPLTEREFRIDSLQSQIDDLELQERRIENSKHKLSGWIAGSLPPDPLDAQRLYQEWLTDLAQMNTFAELKIAPARRIAARDDFTAVQVTLEGKTKIDQLRLFLFHFYQANLMHRMTQLSITKNEKDNKNPLAIKLTAEGLVLPDAPDRERIFPQTELADPVDQGGDKITIAGTADGFPPEGEFRIRIGKEYLTVTEISEKTWTVKRGADSTKAEKHAAKSFVELAPLHPEMKDRTLDDYKTLIADNPFVKPNLVKTDPGKIEAQATFLVAFFADGDDRHIVLHNKTSKKTIYLREGEKLTAGNIDATVKSISSSHVLFEKGDETLKLEPGKNLSQLVKQSPNGSQPTPENRETDGESRRDNGRQRRFGGERPEIGEDGRPASSGRRGRDRGRRGDGDRQGDRRESLPEPAGQIDSP